MRTGWPNADKITPGIEYTGGKTLAKECHVVNTCAAHDYQSVVLFDCLRLQAGLTPSAKKGPVRLACAGRSTTHTTVAMPEMRILKLVQIRRRLRHILSVMVIPTVDPEHGVGLQEAVA